MQRNIAIALQIFLGLKSFYCMACSVRLVFLEPGAVPGGELSLAVGFFLRQETAHQRLWNWGSSHIFVQCFAPLS
jgi:hypothetical protein